MPPVFSIIIPTRNAQSTLARVLESVVHQTWHSYEVIVCDGDSTDRTIDVAMSFEKRLPQLTISSRRDKGVYDAINRALPLAKGEWILIIGSDDQLCQDSTLELAEMHLRGRQEPMVYGNVLVKGETAWARDGQVYDGEFDVAKLLQKNICQQAIFYRRGVFADLGCFDTRFPACADWDFALRVFGRHKAHYMPMTVCVFAAGGISATRLDKTFLDEKPFLILRYLHVRLAGRQFASIRWGLRHFAIRARGVGRIWPALLAYTAFLTMGALERLRSFRVLGGSG